MIEASVMKSLSSMTKFVLTSHSEIHTFSHFFEKNSEE